jgi:hypothetical protein
MTQRPEGNEGTGSIEVNVLLAFDRKLLVGSFMSRIFLFVPDGFRWFQIVPDGCGECQCFDCQQSETIWNKLKPPETT